MNVLTSVGQGFAGRADENDDLDHGVEAEPSSIQGLLSAVTFTPGDVTPRLSQARLLNHPQSHLGSLVLMRNGRDVGAALRVLADNDVRCQ